MLRVQYPQNSYQLLIFKMARLQHPVVNMKNSSNLPPRSSMHPGDSHAHGRGVQGCEGKMNGTWCVVTLSHTCTVMLERTKSNTSREASLSRLLF